MKRPCPLSPVRRPVFYTGSAYIDRPQEITTSTSMIDDGDESVEKCLEDIDLLPLKIALHRRPRFGLCHLNDGHAPTAERSSDLVNREKSSDASRPLSFRLIKSPLNARYRGYLTSPEVHNLSSISLL